jgi:hypothetical protein
MHMIGHAADGERFHVVLPRNAAEIRQSLSRMAGASNGRPSLVENTQCIRQLLNECMVLSSLRDLIGLFDP